MTDRLAAERRKMSIGAIGAYSYYYGMSQSATRLSGSKNNSTTTYDVRPSITLHMSGDIEGEEALTSVGLFEGSSASVYKAESYSAENPEYKVKYWSEDGEEKEYLINPKEVDPENASYIEMLAYTTYADVNGCTENSLNDFVIAARGVNQDITYDAENIDTKYNFKSLVKEMMQLQYDTNNLEGYLDYKKLFDYIDSESTEVNLRTSAVEEMSADEEINGNDLKNIGLTSFEISDTTSQMVLASLVKSSDGDDPIVQVSYGRGDARKVYQVHVNEVDTTNASDLEMFALLSYEGYKGKTMSGTVNNYSAYKSMKDNAGYEIGTKSEDTFVNEKIDAEKLLQEVYDFVKDGKSAGEKKNAGICDYLLELLKNRSDLSGER